MKLRLTLLSLIVMIAASATAQTIVRKSADQVWPAQEELVIVGSDTVSNIIPQRNFGRYDRGLFNYLFVPRGKWGFGLTANYGELSTDNTQILSLLSDVDFQGKIYSIKPFVSYFFDHNQSIGLRLDYTRGTADLGSLAMDFDEDLNFSIKDVSYYSNSFGMSVFYRNYVGLSNARRFAVFNEVDLAFSTGSSRFKRYFDSKMRDTRTLTTQVSLNFSPGVCVFIQEYAALNVSFGVFGLNLRREHQTTDGIDEGSRTTSGANFRFNIFNINFGLMIVI